MVRLLEAVTTAYAVTAFALAACGYNASFEDCTITCSATSGCPSGLTCATSEGLCRTGDTTDLCAAIAGDAAGAADAGTCLTYFDDETAFAGATSALTMNVENFSRTANGSPTPNAFVIQNGSYFFWHDRLTFKTLGVNNAPGSQVETIAVGGNTAPTPSTIMPQISGATARDAIVASFTSNVAAAAFRPSDDEGMQGYMFDITTTSGTSSFPIAATSRTPFVGVVNGCGNVIISAALAPPTPSHWWRLFSVTFGP